LRKIKDFRLPQSNFELERKESRDSDPILLMGIVGTTKEDRELIKPKNWKKELQKVHLLHRKHTYSLIQVTNNKVIPSKIINLSKIYETLAEITSENPSIPGIGLFLQGFDKFEGKNMKAKIRDYLFTINKLNFDSFLKILLIEPILKKMNNQRYQTEDWNEIHLMLRFIGNPIIFNEFIENRYPDRSSKELFFKRGIFFIQHHISITLISQTSFIKTVTRKKGYSDKGSPWRIHKPKKEKEIYSYERTYYCYPEYIDEGGYYMNKKENLEENLYQILVNSTQQYLEWLKQHPERKDEESSTSKIQVSEKNEELRRKR
jgi:hypothetical protein